MKIVTWNSHAINDDVNYRATLAPTAYSMPASDAVLVERVGRTQKFGAIRRSERQLDIDIFILNDTNRKTLAEQLIGWFDPDDETPKALVVEDDGGGTHRQVMAIAEAVDDAGSYRHRKYHATLKIDGDTLWTSVDSSTDTWDITASGQTKNLTNAGDAPAYPKLTIRPTGAKPGGYTFQRWIPIRWRVSDGAVMYPVDIFDNNLDTATLVGAGKMQADGDDVRVRVNGLEVNRWLQDMNNATTQCWISLDFQAKQEVTLSVDCASAGAITEISAALSSEGSTSIGGFPESGTLMIDSEAFVYTGRDLSANKFTGVTRSANGTLAAAHDTTDTIWWVQNDVWLVYGDAAAATPVYTDQGKPIFNLTSTNTSWDYDNFGINGGTRAAAWTPVMNGATQYTANQATNAATWAELGIMCQDRNSKSGYMSLMNPCEITVSNFQNGEYFVMTGSQTYFNPVIGEYHPGSVSGWDVSTGLGITPVLDTWTAWNKSVSMVAGATGVRLFMSTVQPDPWVDVDLYLECADVTLTLNSSNTPLITLGAESSIYFLDCTIKNNTTAESISLDFTMSLNTNLVVDTDAKTVIFLEDGSNQYQALTLVGSLRRDWLKLLPGVNEIVYTETSATAMTIDFDWKDRHYQ